MKLALRYIPTEVWVDVFRYPWISRKYLGEIVHRFRNRKFAEFLQFYLHDWGKRTLDQISFYKEECIPPIPRTAKPENIKFFTCIEINHFDSLTLDFLHRVSTLFISNDVNLLFFGNLGSNGLRKLRTILDHLAPLIHGIYSLSFEQAAIPLMEQHFAPKLAQIKLLIVRIDLDSKLSKKATAIEAAINFCLNWLTSGAQEFSAEPKFLQIQGIDLHGEIYKQFVKALQQQFHSAKSACTFAIEFDDCESLIADFLLENSISEQLHGQFNEAGLFQILRHQSNAGAALQEWVEEIEETSYGSSVIEFFDDLTIGSIGANEVNNAVEEKAQQPSTSSFISSIKQ